MNADGPKKANFDTAEKVTPGRLSISTTKVCQFIVASGVVTGFPWFFDVFSVPFAAAARLSFSPLGLKPQSGKDQSPKQENSAVQSALHRLSYPASTF